MIEMEKQVNTKCRFVNLGKKQQNRNSNRLSYNVLKEEEVNEGTTNDMK